MLVHHFQNSDLIIEKNSRYHSSGQEFNSAQDSAPPKEDTLPYSVASDTIRLQEQRPTQNLEGPGHSPREK